MTEWRPLNLGSTLNSAASATVPAPIVGKLELLPFDGLTWENFERLQWRVLHDVEGLRNAALYGDPGQAQFGLDIVALAADGSGVALQSKKYARFGAGELRAAVKKFRETDRPFGIDRLIIGVSRIVRSTAAVETLTELRKELRPISLELWDAQKLSYLLRDRPAIVIEFFEKSTADAFCLPFELDVTVVPAADAVAVREAMARTPEVVTGAKDLFDRAGETSDPAAALSLVEAGQRLLRDAKFGHFAASHDKDRVRLLAEVGRADEAARQVLDAFWKAADQGLSMTVQLTQTLLGELSNLAPDHKYVRGCQDVTEIASELHFNPLAHLPDPDRLRVGDPSDRVRLAVLAGETALANDDPMWLTSAQSLFTGLVTTPQVDMVLHTRLRLLLAEITSDWTSLLDDAQKLRLGHGLLGLVTARHARYFALRENFAAADAAWDEASGDATLARQWSEAATWVLSRRAFRTHFNPFSSNELLPLQTALREMGPSSPLVPTADAAYEDALVYHRDKRLRSAAISAQRALRDAVASSDWASEERARRALAAIFIDSAEPTLAARHLARAGAGKAIEELGKALPLTFINNVDDLDSPNFWTVGTTFRLLATQADLVPDELVDDIASHALAELEESETRPDLRAFATSRYNNAIKALAGIADRVDENIAAAVLAHFEEQPHLDDHHYRFHDRDEAVAVARIALGHPSLTPRAVEHLTPLLGRSQSARTNTTLEVIHTHSAIARDGLVALAQAGNHWASETLTFDVPEQVDPRAVADALLRLTTPP